MIYALRNKDTLARSILNNIAKEGQNIREYYQRRLPSDPSKDYYFIHRETGRLEPVLVEYGFIDSPKDDVVQLKNNLPNYVEAVVKAVAEYIGVPYTNPGVSDNTYVVKKGDSLYSIAKSFGISVETLKNANGISGNLVTIGQTLVIPSISDKTPGDYAIYTVKKGDSLWKIANSYEISVNDIIDYNNSDTTLLTIGQQLLIPTAMPSLDDNLTYVVKSGDSLWSIAKKYNISVDELKNYNNLMTNMLSIGQILMIPGTDKYRTYIVNSFDTSYFGTTNDIKKINNIKRTEIYTDSEIIVVYDGYLDIGLCDTMEDLIIDMIGSCFGGFVLFGYKKRLQLKSNL